MQSRPIWFFGIVTVALLSLAAQLYRLTMVQSVGLQSQATENFKRTMHTNGPRGSIYDRQGRALATSEPAFAAVLVKKDLAYVDEIMPKLARLLWEGNQQKAEQLVTDVRQRVIADKEALQQYEPITLKSKLSQKVVATFMERREEFAGVILVTESARNYPQGKLAGSLVGYVGLVSANELKQPTYQDNYHGDETVGKDGLELFYERELQGKSGKRTVSVDTWGRPVRDLEETPAVQGNNLHLTLDLDLQRAAEQALLKQMDWIKRQNDPEGNPIRATMVVQDVRTGAILAMASVPTYDPSLFVGGISETDWQSLLNDPTLPMRNWAISGYPPGSTFKMGVGLAGLESGTIGPYATVHCAGQYWNYHKPLNWTSDQGHLDIAGALAQSCDPYFYDIGYHMGLDKLSQYLAPFGFGRKTGIDLPDEQPGMLPTEASYGKDWAPGQVLSVAIGQGRVLASPLQLANYTAAVAMSGRRMQPFVVDRMTTSSGETVGRHDPKIAEQVPGKAETWTRLQQGMRLAVTDPLGTAWRPFVGFPIHVAGKTGSAETGHKWSNGLTVAYAPYENPEIAVSVIIEGGAHGSWVAPAARAVMAKYFGVNETFQDQWINKTD